MQADHIFSRIPRLAAAGFRGLRKKWPETLLLLLFALLVAWVSGHHEVWRDEVRALNLAMQAGSPLDLIAHLRNEGHPALWHLILWAVYAVVRQPAALRLASLAVAVSAVGLFLYRSPFPWWLKALAIFGVFPAYEYSVMYRNYGLSMLLLFGFSALYRDRWRRPLQVGLVVFLLAQTNAHACIISASLMLALGYDFVVSGRQAIGNKQKWVWVSFALMVLGLALSALQMVPDRTTLVTPLWDLHLVSWRRAVAAVLVNPGVFFQHAFGLGPVGTTILLYGAGVYWLRTRPVLLLMFLPGVYGLGLLFQLVYAGSLRHEGLIFILLLSVYWLDREQTPNAVGKTSAPFQHWARIGTQVLVGLLLVLQVGLAYGKISQDIGAELSSSQRLGRFLEGDARWHQAILLPEPDYILEAIPYYASNPVYLARERRFGHIVHFTTRNQRDLTLQGVLDAAKSVQKKYGRPVLIVLGHPLRAEGPETLVFSYNKRFVYDQQMLARFQQATQEVAAFQRSIGDENYTVFALRETAP